MHRYRLHQLRGEPGLVLDLSVRPLACAGSGECIKSGPPGSVDEFAYWKAEALVFVARFAMHERVQLGCHPCAGSCLYKEWEA